MGFQPLIAKQFINTVLGFEGADKITDVTFLSRDLPSQNPMDPTAYNFTVDVLCQTQDGRYFLVEMQNDFRDDYHLKALIEHSRMLGRINIEQSNNKDSEIRDKEQTRKYWKDVQGVYSIVLTNKAFGKNKKKKTYPKESTMEPDLLNTYELRNIHHLERHFGDIPNQITLLMLAKAYQSTFTKRWAYIFQEKDLRHGARRLPEMKAIESPEELAAGDEAMKEFIHRLDMRYLPHEVIDSYRKAIQYYNDSIVSIAEKGKAEGRKERDIEIARNLLSMNLPIDQIQQATGLSEEETQSLKK